MSEKEGDIIMESSIKVMCIQGDPFWMGKLQEDDVYTEHNKKILINILINIGRR